MLTTIQNLCLLIAAAHLLGRLAERLRQPELLGHMVAGMLLGPALLGWVTASPGLNAVADFAVLMVVVAAGLEMRLRSVTDVFRGRGLLALLPCFLLPVLLGVLFARLTGFAWVAAVVTGLCIGVTALPVALRILAGFHLLGTRLAQIVIAGALLADVAVLLTLGVLSQATREQAPNLNTLLMLAVGKLALLLGLVVAGAAACHYIYRRFALQSQRLASLQLSFSLLLILLLAAVSDALGFHFAIGAFLGALIASEYHSDAVTAHPLKAPVEQISHLLFAPLFLAAQGLHFSAGNWPEPLFALWLIALAIVGKLLGGYWTARACGCDKQEARGVAIVMNARGLMEMVIASIAFKAGLINEMLFTTLLLVGCVTTVLTPVLLRAWQKRSALAAATATSPPR